MTDRGPVTRCRIKGCVVVGHFAAYDDRCPMHRGLEWDTPRKPNLTEQWEIDR